MAGGCLAGQDQGKLASQIRAAGLKEQQKIEDYIAEAESYLKEASLSTRFKTAALNLTAKAA